MDLLNLRSPEGSKKRRKRVGRGPGSGHGRTSTRGHKGQYARSGTTLNPGFEGGQMPLIRTIPKRGFNNPFNKKPSIVNVGMLDAFDDGSVVTALSLKEAGLVKKITNGVKILGKGKVSKKLTVRASAFSSSAAGAIKAAGGSAEVA